jgi:nucleoid-associated protein YejK
MGKKKPVTRNQRLMKQLPPKVQAAFTRFTKAAKAWGLAEDQALGRDSIRAVRRFARTRDTLLQHLANAKW